MYRHMSICQATDLPGSGLSPTGEVPVALTAGFERAFLIGADLLLGAAVIAFRAATTHAAEHKLVAPTLVRSQALSALSEAARRGEISARQGIERVTRINSLKVRLLGDKVLQR